ncbi:MAG: hypothetical protein K2X81_29125, partial [Candidatus Obscuribacterales bacterium]|nr:hypothetical protein [Candidatus Obscuribacterales bacterium]
RSQYKGEITENIALHTLKTTLDFTDDAATKKWLERIFQRDFDLEVLKKTLSQKESEALSEYIEHSFQAHNMNFKGALTLVQNNLPHLLPEMRKVYDFEGNEVSPL